MDLKLSSHYCKSFFQIKQIGMTWQYTIEWHDSQVHATSSGGIHATSSNHKTSSIVMVTSKPKSKLEQDLIRVKAWTSKNAKNFENPAKIVLYAQILKGDSPIIGARVSSDITFESKFNGSIRSMPSLTLIDNGFGGKS